MPIPANLHNGFLIHAPRQGRDPRRRSRHPRPADFNPRPLRGDFRNLNNNGNTNKFQPTLPVGGATVQHQGQYCFFRISIHAPVGGVTLISTEIIFVFKFQSTLPVGGATAKMHKLCCAFLFKHPAFLSILAPRNPKKEGHFKNPILNSRKIGANLPGKRWAHPLRSYKISVSSGK